MRRLAGCEGGFPYLVGKFGEDFGFVSEDW